MHRVWMALLLVLTAAVGTGLGYVMVHQDPVPTAGRTPGLAADPQRPTGAADPSTTTAARTKIRTVFLGDDYTAGVGAAPNQGFVPRVAQALGLAATVVAEPNAGYAAQGVDGNTYRDLIDKVVAARPELVVVSGGRNDVTDPPSTVRTAARDLFARLHARLPDATLIAVAPLWGDSRHPAKLAKVDTAVRAAVTAAGGTYLPIADPLRGHPGWMSDAADPTSRGYRAIAGSIRTALRPYLPR